MIFKNRIVGEKIYLRSLDKSDVSVRYLSWIKDPEVIRFLEIKHSKIETLAELKLSLENINNSTNSVMFGIFNVNNEKHIGNIKIGDINDFHKRAELGIMIGDKASWGQGKGSEAISLAIEFSIKKLCLQKLYAGFYIENKGSIRAFEKCGFKIEGVQENHWRFENRNIDGVVMGLPLLAERNNK